MPATLIPALESLSALPRQAADEVELFPSFKGGMHVHISFGVASTASVCLSTCTMQRTHNVLLHLVTGDDWQTMIRKVSHQNGGSALTGEWQPLESAPSSMPEPAVAYTPEPGQAASRSVFCNNNIVRVLWCQVNLLGGLDVALLVIMWCKCLCGMHICLGPAAAALGPCILVCMSSHCV